MEISENITFISEINISTTIDGLLFSNNSDVQNGNDSWNNATPVIDASPDYPEHIEVALNVKILMTLLYAAISVVGILGNIGVCVVVVQNRIMRTATNYYLCSMALSDLLLLVTGMPHEIFMVWVGVPYIFGFTFCVIRGFTAELSTNASILTIAAFTVERYIGICHPLKSHMMSHLSRVKKFIVVIWILGGIFALPQCLQYGITELGECNIIVGWPYTFEISTFLFFIVPMTLITVLYIKIVIELRRSPHLGRYGSAVGEGTVGGDRSRSVINMLVAVVLAFFICFAPFHAQRLVAFYGDPNNEIQRHIYTFLTNVSGITFYLSTCINPVLYHILSRRFRQAFQDTVMRCCVWSKCSRCCLSTPTSADCGLGYNRSMSHNATSIYQHRMHADAKFVATSFRATSFNNNQKYHNGIKDDDPNRKPLLRQTTQTTTLTVQEFPAAVETSEKLQHHTWV